MYTPLILDLYWSGARSMSAAASPFNGSVGLGYSRSCGKKTSNTFTKSATSIVISRSSRKATRVWIGAQGCIAWQLEAKQACHKTIAYS